jgi:hypothetical protein
MSLTDYTERVTDACRVELLQFPKGYCADKIANKIIGAGRLTVK